MNFEALKSFLDEKVRQYENPNFIADDPIQIPHLFSKKQDIEIAGFLTAVIAWGRRETILKSASNLMKLMGQDPYAFVMNHSPTEMASLKRFVHRTFNGDDLCFFITALQHIYSKYDSMEMLFLELIKKNSLQESIHGFKTFFFSIPHPKRTEKHLPDPLKGAAAKRINMFLRWMVRSAKKGVDFGIWKQLSPALLSCPLDVHTGNVARRLGLLKRKQNDARTVQELDEKLRLMDATDPVKYDFALFGLGAYEGFA